MKLLIVLTSLGSMALASAASAGEPMSAARQDAIVQKYCAVCHDDAHRNGGLSLQHFDAANVDPSLAAMMVSKLKTGAIGAAGLQRPDQPTQDAFFNALDAKSKGASGWTLIRAEAPSARAQRLTASTLRAAPSTAANQIGELYRLTLTCNSASGEGEMQLTWAPKNAGNSARAISVTADSAASVTYTVEGHETMGNRVPKGDGTDNTTGPAATVLKGMPLPARTLSISNLFPDESVVFSFESLPEAARHALASCF